MLEQLIAYSIRNKLVILLCTMGIVGFGSYALLQIPIGAVPDVTNNQVQVLTTTRNLSTQDVEQFITYPVELEMANLPGVREIRSVSKFGLSVVTIVFEDDMGSYLPRQLIAEKITSAKEKIPQGFGTPFMGPVSTGLGEIYQYILDVEPGYEDQYSITDLRTIQDWIVKRQLSGIPGVVEVNTWGGKLKQYEVAINPDVLRAMKITVSDIYTALEKNNSVAGGGYIEKSGESYFIRGEGLIKSIRDIEEIVVRKGDNFPVYIKDVASVRNGYATRFGAITANGEGEKVMGQIMMLKDANSRAVINAVKERVAQVQKSLPEGVFINPFLERSELLDKTTNTVAENLILGCLIVIFVVVLLLGNIRSGLVVASVIPLALLFALALMYVFGVDANLMSLGAIDFGIIIDGAVIIVEYIAYQLTTRVDQFREIQSDKRRDLLDQVALSGASRMMRSAVFGQLIIIIVFIPVLSLAGIEGKMFRPMGQTFCFALLGAMILCFTYVPVMSSLVLKPSRESGRNISVRIIGGLNRLYSPAMAWALQFKAIVLGVALSLMTGAGYLFSTMGGEFVPTLDEGDFVIQPVLKTGTSLTSTIGTMTQIETILKKFPEVDQVVTRIGAAEVPTDPMSMEECDVIITLIPRAEWTTAETKDDLAEAFKTALSELPGIDYEFTQPIEMRFNELITGVRADLAIKIYGEDLSVLSRMAQKIKAAIEPIDGASDISVEKVEGLPQMSVTYLRQRIARYGLNIEDINQILTMSFAGLPAGSVFEGEKQFDLVVRYDEAHRKDIENIQNSMVALPNGDQIPFRELATIRYTKGPAKISRDDTRRRIVVGVNVRNRDLESVVEDVQSVIDQNITLPSGYSIMYGGQFENLRNARERLMIAVPIALFLIFILLFFAFRSVKEALMVYSAIPLSAVGGVLLLYVRGMPFSISAGVGFIALFGIAVLNGIVLIEHFKELKAQGMDNLQERVLIGTQQRLRPVLLTATAAALGFLPMAVSTSTGAEVQRPLATVVVGGLITATLLTLFVLPVLYALFDQQGKSSGTTGKAFLGFILLCTASLLPSPGQAQTVLSLDQITRLALEHNAGLRAQSLEIERNKQLIPASLNIAPAGIYYGFDQNNIAENGQPISVMGISQEFQLPSVYRTQRDLKENQTALSEYQYAIDEQALKKAVAQQYYQILYWEKVKTNLTFLDSLYRQMAYAANRRYETGETNFLEKITADTEQKETNLKILQCEDLIEASYRKLARWLQIEEEFQIDLIDFQPIELHNDSLSNHPIVAWYKAASQVNQSRVAVERKQLMPSIQLDYFLGTNAASNARWYNGFQVGLGVPLWRKAQQANIMAAETEGLILAQQARDELIRLEELQLQLLSQLASLEKAVRFYENEGQFLANEMIQTAARSYQEGEIDIFQYIRSLENANTMNQNYLENLLQYNLTVLEINFLMN